MENVSDEDQSARESLNYNKKSTVKSVVYIFFIDKQIRTSKGLQLNGHPDGTEHFCTFKNINKYLNTNIYSYLESSGGISSNLYLHVVHFSTPVLIRHML